MPPVSTGGSFTMIIILVIASLLVFICFTEEIDWSGFDDNHFP